MEDGECGVAGWVQERVGRGVEQLTRLLQWLYSRILLNPATALL